MAEAFSIDVSQSLSITVQKEEVFPMRVKDWARMRKRLEGANKSRRELSAAAWTSVGVVISSVFAAVSWWPAYSAMTGELRADFAWIWPAIVAAGILGIVLATFLFIAAHVVKDQQRITVSSIIDDMDDIHDVRALLESV